MRLVEFIAANAQTLAANCQVQYPSSAPAKPTARTDVRKTEAILNEIVAHMRDADRAREKAEPSGNKSPLLDGETSPFPQYAPTVNAGQIAQVAGEFRALRKTVLGAWLAAGYEPTVHERQDTAFFNDAVDQAHAAAVQAFIGGIDLACKALSEVLGHDLRTPLSTITHCAEIVQSVCPDSKREAQMILRGVAHIGLLADNLLAFGHGALGRAIACDVTPTDLRDIAIDAVAEIRALHPGRDIALNVRGDAGGVWDPIRLRQILINLLARAIRFSTRDSQIGLCVDGSATREARLSVEYSTTPVPAPYVPEFFEVDSGQDGISPGAQATPRTIAIDLHFCREVLRHHGGSIDLHTDDGTCTLVIRLPRDQHPTP